MSRYPGKFDTEENLYVVQDALKVSLGVDYYPGNLSIVADSNINKFPPSGIITLVDQQSAAHERSSSFSYKRRTSTEFLDIENLDTASFKPRKLTMITMQVNAKHREALKDAIISIEEFLGTIYTVDDTPKGKTIFGRINFLKKLLFSPKAWFEADKIMGNTPMTVQFVFSGTTSGETTYVWKVGDDEIVTKEPSLQKTFLNPGNYDVSLSVKNDYGEDSVKFIEMVKVRGQAPPEAAIGFIPQQQQLFSSEVFPKIRTKTNQPVSIEAPVNSDSSIVKYTWNLGDDVPHANSPKTKALYTVGGIYDLSLRTDTNLGTYRVTNYPGCIDVVEPTNVWIWDKSIKAYEFGLISEVFKTLNNTFNIEINDSFVEHDREKQEFWKNNGAARNGDLKSLLFWASGRSKSDPISLEKVNMVQYDGLADTYFVKDSISSKPWNWTSLVNESSIYFVFGYREPLPTLSLTDQTKTTYDISSNSVTSQQLEYRNYKSGAYDLMQHADAYDSNYNAEYGHFTAYRTAWKDNTGYILKNSFLGDNFSFHDFYRTDGTIGSPFQNIVKLADLPGDNHKEGALVPLINGVYFFDNYGMSYYFNDITSTWELVVSHNNISNNVMGVSDKDTKAYLSFDKKFVKFNEIDLTYSSLGEKPSDKDWLMTLF